MIENPVDMRDYFSHTKIDQAGDETQGMCSWSEVDWPSCGLSLARHGPRRRSVEPDRANSQIEATAYNFVADRVQKNLQMSLRNLMIRANR